MDAVITAACRDSRLGELTADQPKGLIKVTGRPLIAHAFEAVRSGYRNLVQQRVHVVGVLNFVEDEQEFDTNTVYSLGGDFRRATVKLFSRITVCHRFESRSHQFSSR